MNGHSYDALLAPLPPSSSPSSPSSSSSSPPTPDNASWFSGKMERIQAEQFLMDVSIKLADTVARARLPAT